MQTTKSSLITLLSMVILIAAVPLAGRSAGSASEKVIYNFRGGSDGANPAGGLVVDKAGNLYGTTSEGGSSRADLRTRGQFPTSKESVLKN